ncbi:putative 3-demethylubiquinone-9 3-methyltransferase (glyoxalase superfamily) [Virgibacillus litoralis]|uniref:3-demethylubiquinone-9 3-methyltransferase (Glyoxalase superfamily) n=1 Tax=Virgibacillus litoralis TaxID=578221 RepID=A0ABS4HIS8_9BACI|nr:putative 3-demethylubiquinone-9 3-methyltransferase (glyoxalase superfamily) [Virgibacillus litoralis]
MTKTGQNIVPHLWYDKEAKEAAEFYASIFPESRITDVTPLDDTPSGDSHLVSFELWGQKFLSINAGPIFKFNPSVSFMVNFDPKRDKEASEELNNAWNKLSEGGKVLMPLDKYPFSHTCSAKSALHHRE